MAKQVNQEKPIYTLWITKGSNKFTLREFYPLIGPLDSNGINQDLLNFWIPMVQTGREKVAMMQREGWSSEFYVWS